MNKSMSITPITRHHTKQKICSSMCSCAVLAGGKNFARNFHTRSSQLTIKFGISKFNKLLALSLCENGKRQIRTTSSGTPWGT